MEGVRTSVSRRGEKLVRGHKISAGGLADGERVLDILATHPATARSSPPNSRGDSLAMNHRKQLSIGPRSILKTDGSIRETLRAIVTAPEFFSASAYRAKIRSPFEYVAAGLRALNAETEAIRQPSIGSGAWPTPVWAGYSRWLYGSRGTVLAAGAMLERFNFAFALASNKLKGTHFDLARAVGDGSTNEPQEMADQLARLLLSDVSRQTRTALEAATPQSPATLWSSGF